MEGGQSGHLLSNYRSMKREESMEECEAVGVRLKLTLGYW